MKALLVMYETINHIEGDAPLRHKPGRGRAVYRDLRVTFDKRVHPGLFRGRYL